MCNCAIAAAVADCWESVMSCVFCCSTCLTGTFFGKIVSSGTMATEDFSQPRNAVKRSIRLPGPPS